MAELSWGRPRIFISKLNNGEVTTWKEFSTPVDGSTKLDTSEGDKKEAKIEGGENEAVKYNKSTYTLEFEVREAVGREQPYTNTDGLIDGEYALHIQPENASAKGIKFDRGVLSVLTQFGSEDGIVYHYKYDALKPATGNTAKVEVVATPSGIDSNAGGGE